MAHRDDAGPAQVTPAVRPETLRRIATVLVINGDVNRRLKALAEALRAEGSLGDSACALLVRDLRLQGWTLDVRDDILTLGAPSAGVRSGESLAAAKARAREALLVGREAQLQEPAVREFLQQLQGQRSARSIADLIDDGATLARQLSRIAAMPLAVREPALADVVSPIVQVVSADDRCDVTGHRLSDVWRYFRHLWSLEYRPTPGRTLQLLVRNAARRNHPVIAIAALSSALPQLGLRDDWVGWTPQSFFARVHRTEGSWETERATLLEILLRARQEVRSDDLCAALAAADAEDALLALSASATADRLTELEQRRGADGAAALRALPRTPTGGVDWSAASERALFRSKRAKLLADITFAVRVLERSPSIASPSEELRRAISIGLRELRKRGLASRIVDLNVCGAVPPYGALLAGKLAALAVASSDVSEAYRARYGAQVSEIASQLAGRPIVRDATLCAITTTSLYAVSASQYNRLHVDVDSGESVSHIRWTELGQTSGFGTLHLSDDTVDALRALATASRGIRHVNNLFGEGPSPRLRQVRLGLECLKIPPNLVLHHNAPRRIYALALAGNAQDALLHDRPLDRILPTFRDIARSWRQRWLRIRIERPEVLARVASEGPEFVRRSLEPRGTQLSLPFAL